MAIFEYDNFEELLYERPYVPRLQGSNEEKQYSWGSQTGAVIRSTPFGALGHSLSLGVNPFHKKTNPSYNAVSKIKGTKYEPFWQAFRSVDSDEDLELKKIKIDKELRDRERFPELLSFSGFSSILAGSILADPTVWIGGGALMALPKTAIGKAVISGVFAGGLTALSETATSLSSETMTNEDILYSAGGAFLLGAAIGGGFGFAKIRKKIKANIKENPNFSGPAFLYNAEASSINTFSKSDLAIKYPAAQKYAENINPERFGGPGQSLGTSPSVSSRYYNQRYADYNFVVNSHSIGETVGQSLETKIDTQKHFIITKLDEVYDHHLKTFLERNLDDETSFIDKIFKKRQNKKAFDIEVVKALSGSESKLREANELATKLKNELLDPLFERQRVVKLIEEGQYRENYFPIYYDKQAIIANRKGFKETLKSHLSEQLSKNVELGGSKVEKEKIAKKRAADQKKMEKLLKQVEKEKKELKKLKEERGIKSSEYKQKNKNINSLKSKIKLLKEQDYRTEKEKLRDNLSDLNKQFSKAKSNFEKDFVSNEIAKVEKQLKNIDKKEKASVEKSEKLLSSEAALNHYTDEIINNIMTRNDLEAFPKRFTISKKGKFPQRTLDIPQLSLLDFTNTDPREVFKKYIKRRLPEVIERESGLDIEKAIKEINADYNRLLDEATTVKERNALEKRRERDIKDLQTLQKRVKGLTNEGDSIAEQAFWGLRTLTAMSQLLGVTLSSLGDIGKLVIHHGLSPVLKDGLKPLITDFKSYKIGVKQADEFANIFNNALGATSHRNFFDIGGNMESQNIFGKGLSKANSLFYKANLMSYFETGKKFLISGFAIRNNRKVLKKIANGTAATRDIEYMAKYGINSDEAKIISTQIEKYSSDSAPNIHLWDDNKSKELYEYLLNRQVRDYNLNVLAGERPRWMDSASGKLLGMYQSFYHSANQRLLLAGLQGEPLNVMQGVISMIALGAIGQQLKKTAFGKEVDDDWRDWLETGIDYSGILGIYGLFNDKLETASSGRLGLAALMGLEPPIYYKNKSQMEAFAQAVLGPVGGYSSNTIGAYRAIHNAIHGEKVSRRDKMALQRLFMMHQFMQLIDGTEKNLKAFLGES